MTITAKALRRAFKTAGTKLGIFGKTSAQTRKSKPASVVVDFVPAPNPLEVFADAVRNYNGDETAINDALEKLGIDTVAEGYVEDFLAALEWWEFDNYTESGISTIKHCAETVNRVGTYEFFSGVDSYHELGEKLVEMMLEDGYGMPEIVLDCVDYAAIGEYFANKNNGAFTTRGYFQLEEIYF